MMKSSSVISRFPRLLLLGGIVSVFFLAGCTNFDYVGRSFAPRSETAKVTIFRERDAMQEGKYMMMGRGVLTVPENYDRYDIEERLEELAREHGADAVLVVNIQNRLRSFNVPEGNSSYAGPSAISANPTNTSPDGRPLEENSFGSQITPTDTYGGAAELRPQKQYYGRKITEVSVIFYRSAEEIREILQAHEARVKEAASRNASDYRPLTSPEPAPKAAKDDVLPE